MTNERERIANELAIMGIADNALIARGSDLCFSLADFVLSERKAAHEEGLIEGRSVLKPHLDEKIRKAKIEVLEELDRYENELAEKGTIEGYNGIAKDKLKELTHEN